MMRWLEARGIPPEETIYVGNDVNDVECLRAAGCGVCVADGTEEAREAADLVAPIRGGEGVVRFLCDLILGRISER
jgi:3-deoxy-D-manno-octulosonate 8-phosphate phosphatase KdsC-like HAD superfamily phosphatase